MGEVAIGEAKPDAGGVVDGKKVYEGLCQACHGTGAAGAPKTGDKGAWGSRIGQGKDTLFKHAIGGFTGKSGVMPAKGGNPALSDEEVKAAVEHMIGLSKNRLDFPNGIRAAEAALIFWTSEIRAGNREHTSSWQQLSEFGRKLRRKRLGRDCFPEHINSARISAGNVATVDC